MLRNWYRPAGVEQGLLPRVVVPLLAAVLVLLAGSRHGARAADNVFVISDSEGYGIMDCLTNGGSCGRVVADAWCEAHGLGPARSFGSASDVTGAVPASVSTGPKLAPGAAIVACGD